MNEVYQTFGIPPQPDEVTLEAAELDDEASWRDEDEEIGYSDGVPVD